MPYLPSRALSILYGVASGFLFVFLFGAGFCPIFLGVVNLGARDSTLWFLVFAIDGLFAGFVTWFFIFCYSRKTSSPGNN